MKRVASPGPTFPLIKFVQKVGPTASIAPEIEHQQHQYTVKLFLDHRLQPNLNQAEGTG